MRYVLNALGDKTDDYPHWWQALKASKGEHSDKWTNEDWKSWEEEKVERLAEKLSKAWGPQSHHDNEVNVMALEHYFGRRLPDVLSFLKEYLDAPHEGVDEDEIPF